MSVQETFTKFALKPSQLDPDDLISYTASLKSYRYIDRHLYRVLALYSDMSYG